MSDTATAAPNQAEITIQRIYVKDLSFEAPQTPAIFQQEWKPEVNLQLQTQTNQLGPDIHEVVLKVTVTVNCGEKTAFLVEVQQGGIFNLSGFTEVELHRMLGSSCPNMLFPYAREVISDLVTRGTFPPLYIAPVNFDALYAQHLQQQNAKMVQPETTEIVTH